ERRNPQIRARRRRGRSGLAGDLGLPRHQGAAALRPRARRTGERAGPPRLSDPRRHPRHAAGRGAAARRL
ncbi:MAG: FIG002473: Protein YcaR in KDO2-Lipid A biosynthesis cluster, partial [uncultured Acetobacteraceae bacterium]